MAPTLAPTDAPAPEPTPVPAPIPTVAPGNPSRPPTSAPTPKPSSPPTQIPTPAPTRTPIVITTVTLSGITCDDFDQDVFQNAMDGTIGTGDATFMESVCTDVSDRRLQDHESRGLTSSSVSVYTELTIPRAVVEASPLGAASAHEYIILVLDDGTDLEAFILSFAERRRLGASDARQATSDGTRRSLASMADISVAAISVETFSPSPAPSPSPTAVPIPAPTFAPTALGGSSSSAAGVPIIMIGAIAGGLVCCVGSLCILVCVLHMKSNGPAPAQSVPAGVEMSMPVVALPVASVSGGLNADQVAKQQASPGQPVVLDLSAQQQPQKHSVAI